MATLAGKGDLICEGTVEVEGTDDVRWVRVTVFNRDTVAHDFILFLDGTPIKRRTLLPQRDFSFPLMAVQGAVDVEVQVTGAQATIAPTYAISGTH